MENVRGLLFCILTMAADLLTRSRVRALEADFLFKIMPDIARLKIPGMSAVDLYAEICRLLTLHWAGIAICSYVIIEIDVAYLRRVCVRFYWLRSTRSLPSAINFGARN